MQITFNQSSEVSWPHVLIQIGYVLATAMIFVIVLVAIAGQINPAPTGQVPISFATPQSEAACAEEGGTWSQDFPHDIVIDAATPPAPTGYCVGPLRAEQAWNAQNDTYTKTVRIVLVGGGVIAALAGLWLLRYRLVALSLLLGALGALHQSTGYEVPTATLDEQVSVIVLVIAWLALLYLGRTLLSKAE